MGPKRCHIEFWRTTPAGWTRKYSIHTSATFARSKDQKIAAKVLVTCELTIFGLRSHSATGEGWADDDNAGTMAEAVAFKRSCACFWTGQVSLTISPERGLPGRSQATKDSAAAGRLGHPRRLVRGPSSSVRQPPSVRTNDCRKWW